MALLHTVPVVDAPAQPPGTPSASRSETLRVSVVIPARDEERNIAWVLERMPAVVDEVLLVDGLSRDRTIEVARMVLPEVVIIEELMAGKGRALQAGFQAATGDVVVMLDADGSMDPADITTFVEAIASGHDVAKGSRFLSGGGTDDMTPLRNFGNAALLRLANSLYGTRHSDLCYGFMAFRRSSLLAIGADAPGFEIEMQLVARASRAHLRVIEVANREHARRHGNSNLRTFRDGFRVLWTMLRERVWRPRPSSAVNTPPVRAS